MTEVAHLKGPADLLCDPAEQYAVALINGPHSTDPDVAAEHVICAPMTKLDRELQPGDWVHARLTKHGLVCDVVREVLAGEGHLALTPLVPDPDLHDILIDGEEVEIRGLVLTYQLSRRVR
jgi:hypothetical protein